jgi:hypothetical protein
VLLFANSKLGDAALWGVSERGSKRAEEEKKNGKIIW